MYSLFFYVPESHLNQVKQAMFDAGAGKIGHYDHCCWQVKGCGQFRGNEQSHGFIGKPGELEYVDEWRVEMAVTADKIGAVLEAFRKTHPYETPAFGVVKVETL